jgi:hypothetical protein
LSSSAGEPLAYEKSPQRVAQTAIAWRAEYLDKTSTRQWSRLAF